VIPVTLDEIAHVMGGRSPNTIRPIPVTGVSTDSRSLRPGDLFFAIVGERFDGHTFAADVLSRGAAGCVVSRDLPETGSLVEPSQLLRVPDTVEALGRLAGWHRRRATAEVVAVTGSNGKTTTKCMIEHVLATRFRGRGSVKSFNNHIGLPLTLLSAERTDQFLVVEIGSNAPGEVASLGRLAQPDIAVVTSIGHAHVGGLGGLSGVRAEKLSLFKTVRPGGLCVVPLDDVGGPAADWMGDRSSARITFGTSPEADVRVSDVRADLERTRFRLNDKYDVVLPVPGPHNARNAAAAFAACRRFRMEPEEVVAALASFQLPDGRLNRFSAGGITVIDDSYNANPTSMAAAVVTLASVTGGRRVFVAGDMRELGAESAAWHARVGEDIARSGIEFVVGVGSACEALIRGAAAIDPPPLTAHYSDAEQAGADLPGRLRPGDTVLVKGSRLVGLERLVRAIREQRVAEADAPAPLLQT
jgi:UDP-N-acetylmuramoyl-tripeptide--D-alanyl-D-alanine ligase